MQLFTTILHYGDPALTARVVSELTQQGGAAQVLDNAAPLPYTGTDWRLAENVFWAGGLQVALERARAEGATHLWFCNNDIVLTSAPPHAARVAARIGRMERRLGCRVGVYAPAVHRSPYHPHMVRRPGVAYSLVSYVDGIAPVLALDCVEAIGGLDAADNPRGYGVDVCLSLRAHRAGWAVVVDHEVTLRHEYHTTAVRVPGFMDAAARQEDAYMTRRMGANWREQLAGLRNVLRDETEL